MAAPSASASGFYGQRLRGLRAGPFDVAEAVHPTGLATPVHTHGAWCLHLVLEGSYAESTRDGAFHAPPGSFLLKPPQLEHWNEFGSTPAHTIRVELPAGAMPQVEAALPDTMVLSREPAVSVVGARIVSELRSRNALREKLVESMLVEVLVRLARAASTDPRRASAQLAHRCASVARRRFTESFGLAQAARELQVNRTHLARAFKQTYGVTLGDYVRSLRVQSVLRALQADPEARLADLAAATGFADQSHLCRVFREAVGMSPGRWRRRTPSG